MQKCSMDEIIYFIRNIFNKDHFIPLHEPMFFGNEKKYLNDCLDSTFVSSVGVYVDKFEREFAKSVGSAYAIATVNGTSALHAVLLVSGVKRNDEVITQPLTFVATCNAISYIGASPIFLDVDLDTMGLSPDSLSDFLNANCQLVGNKCINNKTKKHISACVPMHTFGHPCRIDEIKNICDNWNIVLIEDAAESLGSLYRGKHTGTFGKAGIFSFNGNKIITSGGGGVVVTDDEFIARKTKHITTTSKILHPYEYVHNEIGYNYRMPNLNAALLLAQLEQLDKFLISKRKLFTKYADFFKKNNIVLIKEPKYCESNYWLQAIMFDNIFERNEFLSLSNKNFIGARPIWKLMNDLDIYRYCQVADIKNARFLEERVVNIPSSAIL